MLAIFFSLVFVSQATASSLMIESICAESSIIKQSLKESNLKPLILGAAPIFFRDFENFNLYKSTGLVSFWVNQDTGNFALISTFNENFSCIIVEGTDFEPYIN